MPSSRIGPAGWLIVAIGCAIWPAAYVVDQARVGARHLIIVTRDVAAAPLTLAAHTSVFTGLRPTQHDVRDDAGPPLSPAQVTLAQMLRSCGWQTGAFVGSAVLAADRGLASGFDVYDDGRVAGIPAPARRPGDEVIDRALAWLTRANDAPLFMWVHLSDAPADAPLSRLMRTLDERGLHRDAVVIVAGNSDQSPAGDLVPVSIRAPRISAQRLDGLISAIDLAPTALDLLQLPSAIGDGRSVAPAMLDQPSSAFTRR